MKSQSQENSRVIVKDFKDLRKVKPKFEEQWEPISHSGKRSALGTDEIHGRVFTARTGISRERLFITIGNDVATLCDLKKGDRVVVLKNKLSKTNFLIRKSNMTQSLKLCASGGANGINFGFTFQPGTPELKKKESILIDFDIRPDKSILIDISNMLVGE